MKESIVLNKSLDFAVDIISLCRELNKKREYVISRQILKSSTSIGANIEEALGANSKKDFIAKIHISFKEARETRYWIKLLGHSKIISDQKTSELQASCSELIKIIGRILITSKANLS